MKKQFPDVALTWQTELFGQTLSRETEKLVLKEGDVQRAEDLAYWLPYFSHLKQVNLMQTGLPQEDLITLSPM